jgi:hypothetical protein
MSGFLCDRCEGVFRTSEHDCGVKYVATIAQHEANIDFLHRRLETQVGEHERTKKELALAQQGISSAVQDIKRLDAEVEKLNLELMERDTRPDYERGEMDGQDAMMRHLVKMDEENNSAMANAVRSSPLFKVRAEILRQAAEWLETASYKSGEVFDPDAAKACHFELSVVQTRAEKYAGKKEE